MKIDILDINASGQTDGKVLQVAGGKLTYATPASGGGGTSGVTSVNGKTGAVTLVKADISDFPTLASVATSGNYDDLSNKPGYLAPRTQNVTGVSGTYTVDWSLRDVVEITLSGNTTLTFTGAQSGQTCILRIKQDATGGRTVTWPSDVRFGTDLPSVTLSTAADKTDYIGFVYNNVVTKYDLVSVNRGF